MTTRFFVSHYLDIAILSIKKLNTVFLWLHPLTVSRPGGSVSHHSNLNPGQWGSGFMTSGSMTPHGSPASGLSSQQTGDADDFGDFSQGPSFPGQGGNEGVFSVFQEAAGQPTGQFGGVLPPVRSVTKFNNRLHNQLCLIPLSSQAIIEMKMGGV